MEVVKPGGTLLTVTEHGYGKRTEIDEYRVQSRGGVGIINIATSERNGQVVGVAYVQDGDELLLITQQGMILRMQTNDVRAIGRATQGVRLIDIEGDDKVVSIARLVEKEDDETASRPDRRAAWQPRTAGRRHESRLKRRSRARAVVADRRVAAAAPTPRAAAPRAVLRARRACAISPRCSSISTVVFEPREQGIVTASRSPASSTDGVGGDRRSFVSRRRCGVPDGQTAHEILRRDHLGRRMITESAVGPFDSTFVITHSPSRFARRTLASRESTVGCPPRGSGVVTSTACTPVRRARSR